MHQGKGWLSDWIVALRGMTGEIFRLRRID